MWWDDLKEIPFEDKGRTPLGADCWGLLYIAAQGWGIPLPALSDNYLDGLHAVRDIPNDPVEEGHEQEKDVLLFHSKLHVAIVVRPGRMIHCTEGPGTTIDTYRNDLWKPRLEGIYRLRMPEGSL